MTRNEERSIVKFNCSGTRVSSGESSKTYKEAVETRVVAEAKVKKSEKLDEISN